MNTTRSITANAFNIERGNYYPFGMEQPGRTYNSPEYRYGFNGMEKDDEIDGVSGSKLDFGARIYDSRLGRWLALDPLQKEYPSLSPYNFVANNPIVYVDPDGRVIVWANDANSQAVKKAVLKLVEESKLFAAIYQELENNLTTFSVSVNETRLDDLVGETANGVFFTDNKEINEIIFRNEISELTVSEEFFHAFQSTVYGLGGNEAKRDIQEVESEANLLQVVVLGEIGGNILLAPDASLEFVDKGFFDKLKINDYQVTKGSKVLSLYFEYLKLQEILTTGQKFYGGTQRELTPDAYNIIVGKSGVTKDSEINPPSTGITITAKKKVAKQQINKGGSSSRDY